MNKSKKFTDRLQTELLFAVLISLCAAALLMLLLQSTLTPLLYDLFDSRQLQQRLSDRTAERLQDYVTREDLSCDDIPLLSQWIQKEKYYEAILTDGTSVYYDSYPADREDTTSELNISDYSQWYQNYPVLLRDGQLQLYLRSVYEYQLYNYLYYAEILLSGILFLFLLTLLIRRKLAYIAKLEYEVHILEGGNLQHEITETGQDELASLARGLNAMRLSFIQQIAAEKEAHAANKELITALSHDLRTPLTTQTGYLEIIKERHWKTDEELDFYLDKCLSNGKNIKEMSDRLFEYFLTYDTASEPEETLLEEYDGPSVFSQLLIEQTILLEEKGFRFHLEIPETAFPVLLQMDCLCRVVQNIFSNLQKYADPAEEVLICISKEQNFCALSFTNSVPDKKNPERKGSGTFVTESTKIGLKSVQKMMCLMNGRCDYMTQGNTFSLILTLPIVHKHA